MLPYSCSYIKVELVIQSQRDTAHKLAFVGWKILLGIFLQLGSKAHGGSKAQKGSYEAITSPRFGSDTIGGYRSPLVAKG